MLSAEDDVNGSHSSSIGKINDEELFYIMSRGISKQDAIRMLIKNKIVKAMYKINNNMLQQEILKRIDEKINEQIY